MGRLTGICVGTAGLKIVMNVQQMKRKQTRLAVQHQLSDEEVTLLNTHLADDQQMSTSLMTRTRDRVSRVRSLSVSKGPSGSSGEPPIAF